MNFFYSSILFFFLHAMVWGQVYTPGNELLLEAERSLYNDPTNTSKIASYLLTQNESDADKVKALLLNSKSYYIRGNYNEAIQLVLNAKKQAISLKNKSLKVEVSVFAIQVLRELGLDTVASLYRNEVQKELSSVTNQRTKDWTQAKLKLDTALSLIKNSKFRDAKVLFKEANVLFDSSKDSISVFETNLGLVKIYRAEQEHEAADRLFTKLLEKHDTENLASLQKLKVRYLLGEQYFNTNEFEKAISLFKQTLSISETLPSAFYEKNSLEKLTTSYLAIEDTDTFYSSKQRLNIVENTLEADRNKAINSVYNFVSSFEKEAREREKQQSLLWVLFWGGVLLTIFVLGLLVNYYYVSNTKKYQTISKYLAPKKEKHISEVKKGVKSTLVPEETEQVLLQKLEKFEEGNKYINPDMSIALLASQFETNTKYLSDVINRKKGKNFNSYINELRVGYIIDKLKTDPNYANYKVSYLAQESGFSTHSRFTSVFKTVTGVSPIQFITILNKRDEK